MRWSGYKEVSDARDKGAAWAVKATADAEEIFCKVRITVSETGATLPNLGRGYSVAYRAVYRTRGIAERKLAGSLPYHERNFWQGAVAWANARAVALNTPPDDGPGCADCGTQRQGVVNAGSEHGPDPVCCVDLDESEPPRTLACERTRGCGCEGCGEAIYGY